MFYQLVKKMRVNIPLCDWYKSIDADHEKVTLLTELTTELTRSSSLSIGESCKGSRVQTPFLSSQTGLDV